MLLSFVGVLKTILIIIGIFAILKWWGRKKLQQKQSNTSPNQKNKATEKNKNIKFNDQYSEIEDADYEEL